MDRKKIISFVLLTYAVTFFFFIVLQMSGGRENPMTVSLLGIPMAFPIISALIIQKLVFKQSLKGTLGLNFRTNRWFALSIALPAVMALLVNIISIVGFNTGIFTGKEFIVNAVAGLTIAALSALLEELAWRGFLFNELRYLGLVKASLIIGIIWALWHTPVAIWYKYPGSPLLGALINFLQMFVVSIIITYIRDKSKSVVGAAFMHGMFNTMVLSGNMDDFKLVTVKILIGIMVITILFGKDYYAYMRRR